MSLRPGALLLWCLCVLFPVGGCGSNADQIPIPEAGAGGEGGEGGAGGGDVDGGGGSGPDADEEEEDAPPSACPVVRPLRVSDSPGQSSQPAILWNGTNYLVVWADGRGGGSDIYGTVLTPDGQRVAGMTDFVIADTPQYATSPELVALPAPADGYLVVFENCDSQTDDCAMGSVMAVVLGADGRPTGQPNMISASAAVQRRPYLAVGHGNVYITYRDRTVATGTTPAQTVARVTRLDNTGAPVEPMVTLDEASNGNYPHVAVSPDRVAVVYQRTKPNPEIAMALFNPALTLERELVVRPQFDADATNPVVQWNVQRWVVAWEDEREGGEAGIYASVVTPDGSSPSTPQRAYEENGNWPTIASGGLMTSLIGFYGYPGRRVFLARMEATGVLKPGQVVIDHGSFPAVTYNSAADEYAVVYQNEEIDEILFARFKCAN